MSRTVTTIGPEDAGRRMSLDEFDLAEGREGYMYELSRGVITVTDVPNRRHMMAVLQLRDELTAYKLAHRGHVYALASGSECKILLADLESERHPDLVIYKAPPPSEEDTWSRWIPELVVEVVSPSSVQRDYEQKPEEYLAFGIREYWIVDINSREVTILVRSRGRWSRKIIRPGDVYSTGLLPGFNWDCAATFDAAGR